MNYEDYCRGVHYRVPHSIARQRSAAHCRTSTLGAFQALLDCDYCLDRTLQEDY